MHLYASVVHTVTHFNRFVDALAVDFMTVPALAIVDMEKQDYDRESRENNNYDEYESHPDS